VSKARSVLVLAVLVAALLFGAAVDGQLGAVFGVVLLLVLLAAGFVALAMNTGQYEWATEVIAKMIDPVVARVRAFMRKAWP
jgi:hypothetical protein